MKKMISVILVLAMSIGISACANTEDTKSSQASGAAAPLITPKPMLVIDPNIPEITAEFTVSGLFTNNMVLQRNTEACIWGWSEVKNAIITVSYRGEIRKGLVDEKGEWFVRIPTGKETIETGLKLTVSAGTNITEFTDVVVGDVWFIGGQSNADLMLSTTYEDKANVAVKMVAEDNVRIFYQNRWDVYNGADGTANVALASSVHTNPIKNTYKWVKATTSSINNFSAMGMHFANTIQKAVGTNVPIGLIQVASGGANLAELSPMSVNEKFGISGGASSYIYNTLIAPTEKFSVTGMLWYQGESDSASIDSINKYPERFQAYVRFLREQSGSTFSVLVVQLASHHSQYGWMVPEFRAMQTKMVAIIPNSYLVVSADTDEWIKDYAHPRQKQPVGERLGKIALSINYNTGTLEDNACPLPDAFSYNSNGATISYKLGSNGLKSNNGGDIKGFELKDSTGKWAVAQAIANGSSVVVTADGVSNPTGVRYGFAPTMYPAKYTLVNGSGLPAGTFDNVK